MSEAESEGEEQAYAVIRGAYLGVSRKIMDLCQAEGLDPKTGALVMMDTVAIILSAGDNRLPVQIFESCLDRRRAERRVLFTTEADARVS